MAYRHGVYTKEVPTSILPPVVSEAAMPVVFGTAPVNMTANPAGAVNRPVLCYGYAEAVEAFGFVPANAETGLFDYTISEFMRSHFALFAAAPVVFINVLDPAEHKTAATGQAVTVADGRATLPAGVLRDSLELKFGEITLVEGTDYDLTFGMAGELLVHAIDGGAMPENGPLTASYDKLDPSLVDSADIIGGIDPNTGAATGLELLNEIFPRFRLIPGQVHAPGFSTDPAVEAVKRAKSSSINGHFKAISVCDIPTDEVTRYSDAAAWKNDNNVMDTQQVVCWPMAELGGEKFHLSTQLAGVICRTDANNSNVPYKSPSNESLQAVGMVLKDGSEVFLGPDNGAYLNGQGVVTGINFIGGWVAWGNRTAAYPANSDPKDAFIAIRRMFNWISNTLILTFWQRVDNPLNRRQIDTVLDSANIWLNGLASQGYIVGGRVEFLQTDNPTTDMMDGISRFRVRVTPPSPNREIEFILEYDPAYLAGLFS